MNRYISSSSRFTRHVQQSAFLVVDVIYAVVAVCHSLFSFSLVRVYRAECLFQRPHADYLNAVVFAAAERREALFRDYAPLKSEPRAFLDALPDVGSRPYLSAEPDLAEHHQLFRYHLVA